MHQRKDENQAIAGEEVLNINELQKGESAYIKSFAKMPENLRQKLADLGLTKGERVTFLQRAPLGDPVWIEIRSYQLSFSVAIAKNILLQRQQERAGKARCK